MNNYFVRHKKIVALTLVCMAAIVFFVFLSDLFKSINSERYLDQIEYIEDVNGTIDFQEISDEKNKSTYEALWNAAPSLMKGFTTSTWWVRIKTEDLIQQQNLEQAHQNQRFLAIINPSTEKLALYIPTTSGSKVEYTTYYAGWGYPKQQHGDEGFSYPVFQLPDTMSGEYVYLELSSSYTTNYSFRLMNQDDFNQMSMNTTGIIALFSGLMIAFGINNFIQFASFRIKAPLYYVIYLIAVLIYQLTVLGVVRLYFGSFAEVMIANVAAFGLLFMIAGVYFFRALLDTKNTFPIHHKITGVFIFILFIAVMAIFMGFKYWGNIASVLLSYLTGLLVMYITFLAIRRKVDYAIYLFAGWIAIFIVSIIFNLRAWGLLPNNEFTLFFILTPVIAQAIFFSFGLRGFVVKLTLEKEDAIRQYQIAEGQAISKEAAFLQAQIKQHFLFNALNVIEALCYINANKAGQLILDLSKFLQHSFDFRNLQKYIPFDEEMEFIKAYVRIEQVRFKDGLKVEYELEDTDNLMLPPLILQPLIENSIKHGIRKKGTEGTVTIRVNSLPEFYKIEVEDDGEGMTEEAIKKILSHTRTQSGGVGLSNIQKRLRMFYDTDLILESQIGVGTKATILLPKQREWDNESSTRG